MGIVKFRWHPTLSGEGGRDISHDLHHLWLTGKKSHVEDLEGGKEGRLCLWEMRIYMCSEVKIPINV